MAYLKALKVRDKFILLKLKGEKNDFKQFFQISYFVTNKSQHRWKFQTSR
jgi:hypothetical protein